MGCCASKDESSTPAKDPTSSSGNASNPVTSKAGGATTKSKSAADSSSVKEEQIQLAFKAKRANLFAQSADSNVRREFTAQNIPKTPQQTQIISEIYNFFKLLRSRRDC